MPEPNNKPQSDPPGSTAGSKRPKLVSSNFVRLRMPGRKGKTQGNADRRLRFHQRLAKQADSREQRLDALEAGMLEEHLDQVFSAEEEDVAQLSAVFPESEEPDVLSQKVNESGSWHPELEPFVMAAESVEANPDLLKTCVWVHPEFYQDSSASIKQVELTNDRSVRLGLWVDVKKILQEVWRYPCFREGQLETIRRILCKQSTLFVSATGSGKSLCYQLPSWVLSLLRPGSLTIVISPMVALMHDQVRQLPPSLPGFCWCATASDPASADPTKKPERSGTTNQRTLRELREGKYKILFVSPERLCSRIMVQATQRGVLPPTHLVCVDEAHCQSMWSHSFRPAYLHVNSLIKELLGSPCLLAMTGTLTPAIEPSLVSALGLDAAQDIIRLRSVRTNLLYSVSQPDNKDLALLRLLRSPPFHKLMTLIVYVNQQAEADRVAAYLTAQQLPARSYHANKAPQDRMRIQQGFMTNTIRILVATVAFGLGVNKPDTRGIIHYHLPRSLEDYVQETGRCGRDGQMAYCHLFLDKDDYLRLRSLSYSDTIEPSQVRRWCYQVFNPLTRLTHHHPQCAMFTVVNMESDCQSLDIKPDVARTLLSYLEVHPIRPLRRVEQWPHSVSITFLKSDPWVLAGENFDGEWMIRSRPTSTDTVQEHAFFRSIIHLAKLQSKSTRPIKLNILECTRAWQAELNKVGTTLYGEVLDTVNKVEYHVDPSHVMTRLGYWRGRKELAVKYGPLVTVVELDPEAIGRMTNSPRKSFEKHPTVSIPQLEQYTDTLVSELTEHVQTLTTTKVRRIDLVYNLLRTAKNSFVATDPRSDKTKRPQDIPPSEFIRRKQTKFVRQWLGRYLDQETVPNVNTQSVSAEVSSLESTGNHLTTDPAPLDILTTLQQWQTLCDPTILIVQSKSIPVVQQTIASLFRRYPTVPSGRTIARIFHGLPSPRVTALEWRGTGLWRKFHYIDFDALRVLAHQTIVRIRCESGSPMPEPDLNFDTETTV